MDIPIRLYRKASGEICETLGPGESAQLLVSAGSEMPAAEAQRLGIVQYLERRTSRLVAEKFVTLKAVEKAEVEDKAVVQDEVEDKGIMIDRSRVRRSGTP